MSRTSSFLKDIADSLLKSLTRSTPAARPTSKPTGAGAQPATEPGEPPAKGQSGPSATVEIDPRRIGAVRMTYAPKTDGDPDPGEIVWTWVPYVENDGRGKDRPVLVVAAETGGTVLAVQLTSKSHDGDAEFVALGSGSWDAEGRPSWVNLERVLRVHPAGMRREATALDGARFATVKAALKVKYRWS